jgi:hypothetical protein
MAISAFRNISFRFMELTVEANYCLQGLGVVSGYIGEGLTDVLSRWSKLIGG